MSKKVLGIVTAILSVVHVTEFSRETTALFVRIDVAGYANLLTGVLHSISSSSLAQRAQIWVTASATAAVLIAYVRTFRTGQHRLWTEACCLTVYLGVIFVGLWLLFGHDVPLNVLAGLSLIPISILLGWMLLLLHLSDSRY